VYLNGQYLDESQAVVSIDDRGFLFADGVYEVVHIYDGEPFEWDAHMRRLERSLTGLAVEGVDIVGLSGVRDRLIADNPAPEAALYIQITRGVQRRSHALPPAGSIVPTGLMWVRPVSPLPRELIDRGASLITVPDDRWAKVWIKTIGLLPNVLAKAAAQKVGAFDAVFVRDGMVTEATSANIFRVVGDRLETAPVTNYILPGVTRAVVLELAREAGLFVVEMPFGVEDLYHADEVFLSGTLTEVLPVSSVDGRSIQHASGPVARDLLNRLHQRVGRR